MALLWDCRARLTIAVFAFGRPSGWLRTLCRAPQETRQPRNICHQPSLNLPHSNPEAEQGRRHRHPLLAKGRRAVRVAIQIHKYQPRCVSRCVVVPVDFSPQGQLAVLAIRWSWCPAGSGDQRSHHGFVHDALYRRRDDYRSRHPHASPCLSHAVEPSRFRWITGRDGPRLWGSGRWRVGDQKTRLQPAHGCSIGLFWEGTSEIQAEGGRA